MTMRRILTAAIGMTLLAWAALPASAAEAAKKIKVLIVTGDDVGVHPWYEVSQAIRETLLAAKKFETLEQELDWKVGLRRIGGLLPIENENQWRLMEERLHQLLAIAAREEQGVAVLFLALGRCPASLHAVGNEGCDELLRCVGVRLRNALRETDTLAVLQKGEFGILLPKAGSERELLPVVNKLLEAMREHHVPYLIFSSSAATYGEPQQIPIPEDHPQQPTNAYGETKRAFEQMLRWYDMAFGLRSISLRYFNAAGADPEGQLGEDHHPETHLIPLVLLTALGKHPVIRIFGTDYDTPDGTAIRDYIHVTDLADAHILAYEALKRGAPTTAYNLGNGLGYSVREVIRTAEEVVGHPVPQEEAPRRAGDPARLVASAERARRELGWRPQYAELHTIIETAWRWHSAHPDGYGDRA